MVISFHTIDMNLTDFHCDDFGPLSLKGVVEGDLAAVEAYKSSGGDIARQLTSDEVRLLNRPSAFDDGFTLVHLAIRFQRQDMLAVLLTEVG